MSFIIIITLANNYRPAHVASWRLIALLLRCVDDKWPNNIAANVNQTVIQGVIHLDLDWMDSECYSHFARGHGFGVTY